MRQYEDYFSEESIIELLCRYRVREADRRHKVVMAHKVTSHPIVRKKLERAKKPSKLDELLPPRSEWIRPRKQKRDECDPKKITRLALKARIYAVRRLALAGRADIPVWYWRLREFIHTAQLRALAPSKSEGFTRPIIYGEAKPTRSQAERRRRKKRGEKLQPFKRELRPIADYILEDKVIITLTARYLSTIFDCEFCDSSYAFRKKRNASGQVRSHHDAIVRILEFREQHANEQIWVAECDIKKFFDCIDHEIVRECMRTLERSSGIVPDNRAMILFERYLSSYSFGTSVLPLNSDAEFQEKMPGQFPWPEQDLMKRYGVEDISTLSIGIPQGGALSCFIANLVMHSADLSQELFASKDFLYLRFCDDMVLLATRKAICEEGYGAYCKSADELGF